MSICWSAYVCACWLHQFLVVFTALINTPWNTDARGDECLTVSYRDCMVVLLMPNIDSLLLVTSVTTMSFRPVLTHFKYQTRLRQVAAHSSINLIASINSQGTIPVHFESSIRSLGGHVISTNQFPNYANCFFFILKYLVFSPTTLLDDHVFMHSANVKDFIWLLNL